VTRRRQRELVIRQRFARSQHFEQYIQPKFPRLRDCSGVTTCTFSLILSVCRRSRQRQSLVGLVFSEREPCTSVVDLNLNLLGEYPSFGLTNRS
jgi:hypothetical protein